MSASPALRTARPDEDAEALLAVYAPAVVGGVASFEYELPSVDEFAGRVRDLLRTHPWLVAELDGEVVGYAYGGVHRSRAAYQWSVEVSVYVAARARRRGVARALYGALFEVLALQGFVTAFAGITLPNPASVALHEALGFEPIGVFRHIGHKASAWHDVGWWQRALRPLPARPEALRPYPAVEGTPAWEAALRG